MTLNALPLGRLLVETNYTHNTWDTDLPVPPATRIRNWSLAVKMTYWLSR